jgi:ABC-type sugar transport system substrate-binding protein
MALLKKINNDLSNQPIPVPVSGEMVLHNLKLRGKQGGETGEIETPCSGIRRASVTHSIKRRLLMKAKLVALSVFVILAMLLAACAPAATPTTAPTAAANKAPASTKYEIGYMAPNSAQGQIIFMDSFVRYAQDQGMDVLTVNAESDVTKQDTQCSDLISKGVNAIVVVAVDSKAISACVDRAAEAKIPVFGIDRQPFNAKVVMTVQSDNVLAGQQGAQCIVDRLTQKYGSPKGDVIEVTGDLGTDVAQARGKGFEETIKKYPNIKLTTLPTDWSPEKGATVVQNAFAKDPGIDAIFWHSDYTGAGIIPALSEIGKTAKVGEPGHIITCGIDGDPTSLLNMAAGTEDATVNQPMTDFGLLAKFVKMYLDGQKLPTGAYTQTGAHWSPANISQSPYGLTLLMGTWLITKADVNDKTLWGNFGK